MTEPFRITIFCLVLILLSVIVFEDVRTHQFVFDGLGFINRNSMVRDGLTWNGFTWAFTTRHMGILHPLTWLSHMLDCQIFGLEPVGPHLTNLFFHIANSVLLFLLLQFCTRAAWPSFLVAALFAVNPLHVMLLCLCLGLMAKPMLVILALVLLLWDYWPL